jgi:hypothetical protein
LAFGFGQATKASKEVLLTSAFGLYYHATISRPKPKAKAKSTYLGAFVAYKPKSKSHK